jgi:hypothetical protein
MYEQTAPQMHVPPLSTKWATRVKMRVKSPAAPPSVDYAFYDAYRAESWAGARARAHLRFACGGPGVHAAALAGGLSCWPWW